MKRLNPASQGAEMAPAHDVPQGCAQPIEPGVWRLRVWVQPGAKRTEPAGLYQEHAKIKLAAPPVDGKANKALVAYVAQRLGLKPGQVSLERGQASRSKSLRISAPREPAWSRVLAS